MRQVLSISLISLAFLSLTTIAGVVELTGLCNFAQLGYSISGAGDINGDGFDDVLIGSFSANPNLEPAADLIYVLFGSENGISGVNLTNLTSSDGFKIISDSAFSQGTASVSGAGDINGDGVDDIAIGRYSDSPMGRIHGGSVQVIFGSRDGLSDMKLNNLTSAQGFFIMGEGMGTSLGQSIKAAGDVNGDGIDDLVIAGPYTSYLGRSGAGVVYVIFGSWRGLPNIDLTNFTSSQGFKILGASNYENFGSSVSGAGDFNGDGVDDIIIGSPLAGSYGAAYVIFGNKDGLSDVDTQNLSLAQGIKITGANDTKYFGNAVSGAGDINGDGVDDIIVGAYWESPLERNHSGAAYVIFGSRGGFTNNINVTNITSSQGFKIIGGNNYGRLGVSVSDAGDVNRDGFDDIIVGEDWAHPFGLDIIGAAYVIFGRASGLSNIDVKNLTSAQGVRFTGQHDGDYLGHTVSSAGDINGDGVDEVIIGADNAKRGGFNYSGAVYIMSSFASKDNLIDELLLESI